MSNWRDHIKLSSCMWFDNDDFKRNSMFSVLSGLLFFVGWWLVIDANVVYSQQMSTSYYVWGILGTISLIMVNAVSQSQDSNYGENYFGLNGPSVWLFAGFVLGFASVIASFWIFFQDFYSKDVNNVPGVELLLQNVMIFLSSLFYKFGRFEEHW